MEADILFMDRATPQDLGTPYSFAFFTSPVNDREPPRDFSHARVHAIVIINEMLQVGKLGKQIVVISQKGFERIFFQEAYRVDASAFYPRFVEREGRAKKCYYEKDWRDGIFIMDILREEMIGDDKRIQQAL